MKYPQPIHDQDPRAYAHFVALADRVLMMFYAQAARNIRSAARVLVALVPLVMLLVGSCKTAEMPGAYGGNAGDSQFRTALFPDRVNAVAADYKPAAGYVSRAQKFVTAAPEALTRLTTEEVSYIFGAPSVERHDAEATIWQYKVRGCVVDFYFYEGEAGAAPVSYVDFRGGDKAADIADQQSACLRKIARGGAVPSRRA